MEHIAEALELFEGVFHEMELIAQLLIALPDLLEQVGKFRRRLAFGFLRKIAGITLRNGRVLDGRARRGSVLECGRIVYSGQLMPQAGRNALDSGLRRR